MTIVLIVMSAAYVCYCAPVYSALLHLAVIILDVVVPVLVPHRH